MNKRRLLAMADFLETKVPHKQFNFGVVVTEVDELERPKWLNKPLSPNCGAAGCAMGWAPSMRCFKREGWTFAAGYLCAPDGRTRIYENAAMEMFDITFADAEFLFAPGPKKDGYSGFGSGATPKQVAKHIRKFVAERS